MWWKNDIISLYITPYYNKFISPTFLIFLVDSLDVKILKDNNGKIETLFNPTLVNDSFEYQL